MWLPHRAWPCRCVQAGKPWSEGFREARLAPNGAGTRSYDEAWTGLQPPGRSCRSLAPAACRVAARTGLRPPGRGCRPASCRSLASASCDVATQAGLQAPGHGCGPCRQLMQPPGLPLRRDEGKRPVKKSEPRTTMNRERHTASSAQQQLGRNKQA